MSLTKGVELLKRRALAFASAAGMLAAAAGADPRANEVGELPEMLADAETPAARAAEAASDERQGFPFRVSVFCTDSWDAEVSPLNTVLLVDASPVGGGGQILTGIGWDVILRTLHPASWLSEIAVRVSDSSGMGGVVLRPGSADNFPGGPTRYNSGGIIKFANIAVPNIVLMPDNLIRFEFFETFDDQPGVIDGRWVCGHLTVSMLHPTAVPGSPGGQFFSTEASFATAAGGLGNLTVEGFETTPVGALASDAITTIGGGVTITPSIICPVSTRIGVYTVIIVGAHPIDGDQYLLVAANPTNVSCPTGHSSILTIDLPAPSTAFGVHITDWGDFLPGATLTLTTPTGINHEVAVTPPALPGGNDMFVGVTGASVPFTRVVLTSTAIGESFGIDRILFGDPDCSVASPPCRPAHPGACPGDANGDGTVTFADVSAVLENWGAAYALDAAAAPGDANADGAVSFDDVSSVLAHWGGECSSR